MRLYLKRGGLRLYTKLPNRVSHCLSCLLIGQFRFPGGNGILELSIKLPKSTERICSPVVENLKMNFTQDDLFPPADISSQKLTPEPGVASTSSII